MLKPVIVLGIFWLCLQSAWAVIDTYEFSSENHRQRYYALSEELRCPKCKNNSLADSNAGIAVDLKREIHTMIEAGQSDQAIIDFMQARYGDFVLYKPRLNKNTLFLWGAPIAMLLLGVIVAGVLAFRSGRVGRTEVTALSAEEQAQLQKALELSNK